MEKFLDKTGREFKVGDYFVGAFRQGDVAVMKFGRITRVGIRTNGYPPKASAVLRMRTIDDQFNWREIELLRETTMVYPERSCIIDPSILPQKYLALLGPLVTGTVYSPTSILVSEQADGYSEGPGLPLSTP